MNEIVRKELSTEVIRHSWFYFCMVLLWGTLILKNLFEINVPVFAFLVYAVMICLSGNRSEMVALAFSCIPLSTSLQYKYIILIVILFYVLKYRNEIQHMPSWSLFGVYIMVWEIFHMGTMGFSITEYIRSFTELIFCILVFSSDNHDYDYSLIRRVLAITTTVVTGIILLNLLRNGNSLNSAFTQYYRFGASIEKHESFSGAFNPNELGFICNLAIVGILQEIYQKRQNLLSYIMLLVLAFCGVLTMSRTFLLCAAVLLVLFALSKSNNIVKTLFRILIIGIVVGGFYYLFTVLFPAANDILINRLEMSDFSNGRFELIEFFNRHIISSFNNLMFGIGLQNVSQKIISLYGRDVVPHNAVQEILLIWGIPGLFLVIVWLIKWIRGAIRSSRANVTYITLMPLILILLKVQFGQFFRSGKNILALGFAFISLCQIIDNENNSSYTHMAE